MRFRPWLACSLLLLAAACKPQRSGLKKELQLTTAPPAALAGGEGTGLAPKGAYQNNLLANVAKRLIGLAPEAGDQHDHIGLSNVAALVGYDLASDDCGSGWTASVALSSDAQAAILSLSSDHHEGAGPNCNEPSPYAPVTYLFKAWFVATDRIAVTEPPPSKGQGAPAPPQLGSSNATNHGGVTARSAEGGQRSWQTSESLAASSDAAAASLVVEYRRQVPAEAPAIRLGQQSQGYGLYAVPSAEPKAPPSFAVRSFSPTKMQALACRVSIPVVPGCPVTGVMTATVAQSVTTYAAELNITPRMVGFRGRLGSKAPCWLRRLRQSDGSCGGAMGSGGKGVEAWFGQQATGFDFAQDMAAQASARRSDSAGEWDFAAVRLMPGQENQGIPNLDWALKYFATGGYGRTSVQFDQVTEELQGCRFSVSLLPGSAASCTTPAARDVTPSDAGA